MQPLLQLLLSLPVLLLRLLQLVCEAARLLLLLLLLLLADMQGALWQGQVLALLSGLVPASIAMSAAVQGVQQCIARLSSLLRLLQLVSLQAALPQVSCRLPLLPRRLPPAAARACLLVGSGAGCSGGRLKRRACGVV